MTLQTCMTFMLFVQLAFLERGKNICASSHTFRLAIKWANHQRGYIFGWAPSNKIIHFECYKVLQSLKCRRKHFWNWATFIVALSTLHKAVWIEDWVYFFSCVHRGAITIARKKGRKNPIITRHYSSTHFLENFLPSCCSEHKSHIHCILSVRRKNCSQAKTFICKNVMGIIKAWLRNFPWKPVGSSTSSIAENYKENRL